MNGVTVLGLQILKKKYIWIKNVCVGYYIFHFNKVSHLSSENSFPYTQVDVTGTLQFWDVTIDTASSILITLCVGLAVDYSAHVGHMFMTLLGSREGMRYMYRS